MKPELPEDRKGLMPNLTNEQALAELRPFAINILKWIKNDPEYASKNGITEKDIRRYREIAESKPDVK